jgi:16S rRNA (cytosine1402-N4)-methyltransferase
MLLKTIGTLLLSYRAKLPMRTGVSLLRLSSSGSHEGKTDSPAVRSDNYNYDYHVPVMLDNCCSYLMWKEEGGVYVDCTMGGGGHTREILQRGGSVIAIDQDPDSIAEVESKLWPYIKEKSLEIHRSNFRHIAKVVAASELSPDGFVDGVIFDLGISSHQIDEGERGFAFAKDGPLDMRMSKGNMGSGGLTAHEIVNTWTEDRIADVLYKYGEEPRSRKLARNIVASRPLETTGDLKSVLNQCTHHKFQTKTLARCFQALRIVVNDEMAALEQALMETHNVVRPGGRLVVMSYHSLEDRMVKRLMKDGTSVTTSVSRSSRTGCTTSSDSGSSNDIDMIEAINAADISTNSNISADGLRNTFWMPVTRKAIIADDTEVRTNNRSRSAKLRVAERVHTMDLNNKENQIFGHKARKSKFAPGMKGKKELERQRKREHVKQQEE